MRTAIRCLFLVLWLAGTAAADPTVLAGRVTDLTGNPVAGARIHILAATEHKTTLTDSAGRYRVELDGDAAYSVVIAAGALHTFRRGTIKKGQSENFDVEVESADGEIIRIVDSKPPTVHPKLKTDALVAPAYSEEAVTRDAWAKAWLVLDVDETGKVARVKLLKRPGFDLDEIAVKEAMKLRFEPALDEHGKPMRTQMLWSIEWPSWGWLSYHGGTTARLPPERYAIEPFVPPISGLGHHINVAQARPLHHVPCAGSGPLNLDQLYPVYRDCSRPNLKRASALPWYDGTTPLLSLAEESTLVGAIDPSLLQKPPSRDIIKHSLVPAIVSSAVTATLATAFVVSLVKYRIYWGRTTDAYQLDGGVPDVESLQRNQSTAAKWQKRMFATGITGVLSGLVTSFFWFAYEPAASFSVQPEASGGGSVTYRLTF